MCIYSRCSTEANMRRSKIVLACWIVAAVFFGSCDRSPEAKLAKHVKRGDAICQAKRSSGRR